MRYVCNSEGIVVSAFDPEELKIFLSRSDAVTLLEIFTDVSTALPWTITPPSFFLPSDYASRFLAPYNASLKLVEVC